MSNGKSKVKGKNTFSPDLTTESKEKETIGDEAIEERLLEKFEEIFDRACQTVKPIINREAEHEVVGEEIFNFKMDCRF